MANTAKEVIIPNEAGIFRVVFLYVGQGDATLLVVPDGDNYIYVLIDMNVDKSAGGINVQAMLDDLLDDKLDAFINTHPHKDHLHGIEELHNSIGVKEIWHSGHKPSKDHDDSYQELKNVIKDIGTGNEFILFGSNTENKVRQSDKETEIIKKIGDADYTVLSPAEFVADDIEDEDPQTRDRRIHEHCSVIVFSYGDDEKQILITGDSDKKSWEEHITDYHEDKLPSAVLSASHHGSRTFFKNTEDDEDVYETHIEKIDPSYLIVSAPKQTESRHDHPHDDAIKIYKKHLDDEDIIHLGENRESVIVDISESGTLEVKTDKRLVEEYGFDNNGKKSSGNSGSIKSAGFIGSATSQLDKKPMG
jgi:competence protein ComEC